ncbi:kinase-like domain-containing protein [Penicillium argentinense]|uniref:Kinase-like domain-containing protein n=1 Tax=Penicillium argentinense TaxID=1131581 RepID=A0A9W9EZZ4_9EURO|nr:kinase-like domain-containing protein [Penicillium argentinense]KAJ5091038.1 kinase-like domain-containing protein [Penicillium argentinense]
MVDIQRYGYAETYEHSFVTLKLYERDSSHAKREIEAFEHLKSLKSSHTGTILLRTVLDKFQLRSIDGSHFYQCLIHPPLAMSLLELRKRTARKVFPENLLKSTLNHILIALDFLHSEAHVIHTDIQEKNVMLDVEDESILVDFENAEISIPSPRKLVGNRTIYYSRKLGIPKMHGRPVLADFGEARFGSDTGTYYDIVQPFIYRAPEVILRMPWNEKIDIWNLAVLTWDLFEQGHLFKARDANKQESESHHLAEMIAYLGPPPREMLDKSEYANNFFDTSGTVPTYYSSFLFQFVFLTGGNQGNGRASLKSLLSLWRNLKATFAENIKQIFSGSCAGCFDGDRKKDLRRKSCYQTLG